MPNNPIPMIRLRTIIRLYAGHQSLKSIATMCGISRVTVKKYITKWNTLDMSFGEFQRKSDAELRELFCADESPTPPVTRPCRSFTQFDAVFGLQNSKHLLFRLLCFENYHYLRHQKF
jgi:predicted transcriptional regulator